MYILEQGVPLWDSFSEFSTVPSNFMVKKKLSEKNIFLT